MEHFAGRVVHSHDYRVPEEFAGQTVALLGAGFSGERERGREGPLPTRFLMPFASLTRQEASCTPPHLPVLLHSVPLPRLRLSAQ